MRPPQTRPSTPVQAHLTRQPRSGQPLRLARRANRPAPTPAPSTNKPPAMINAVVPRPPPGAPGFVTAARTTAGGASERGAGVASGSSSDDDEEESFLPCPD